MSSIGDAVTGEGRLIVRDQAQYDEPIPTSQKKFPLNARGGKATLALQEALEDRGLTAAKVARGAAALAPENRLYGVSIETH
jgi:hypothetical protein